MRLIAILFLFSLSACTVTGNSKLQVRAIDQLSHRPIANAPMVAEYRTMWPAPMANPRRVERTSDASGSTEFDRLADGVWSVTAPAVDGQQQEAWFSISDGTAQICIPEGKRAAKEGTVGLVKGDFTAKPEKPVIFYGELAH